MKSNVLKVSTWAVLAGLSLSANAIEIDDGTNIVFDAVTTNDTELYVGRYNDNNILSLVNGSSISVENAYVGPNSDNNELKVFGSNTLFRATESLEVSSNQGQNNSVSVQSGGRINIGSNTGTAGAISIGSTNDNVIMTIAGGSSASADALYVGTAADETGELTLSGTGTELTVDNAFIGLFGSNNVVNIQSGSIFTISNLLQIGSVASTNNNLNIFGETVIAGSVSNGNPDANTVNIKNGGKLTYTGNADLNNASSGGFNFENGSTLEIGGALQFDKMDSGVSVILNNNLNTNLTSIWDTGLEEMYVGDSIGANNLSILGGATAVAGGSAAHIGEFSNNNSVLVEGSNSTFTVNGQLLVGMQGDRNELTVSEGAFAGIGGNLRIGFQSSANNNSVSLSAGDAQLDVGGDLLVGEKGRANTLNMESNTLLNITGSFLLGDEGNDNTANIDGSNAVVNIGDDLLIGLNSSGNEMYIASGAQMVLGGDLHLGTNGMNNRIEVAGTNAYLEIAGSAWLGNAFETNELTGNILAAYEAGQISIGSDLSLYNGSEIQIEPNAKITVGGDYFQDESSALHVALSTNAFGMTNLAVTGSATFETNTSIYIVDYGTQTNTFEQTIVSSSGLFFGTNTATTALLNDTNVINLVNDLLYIGGIVTNDSILLTTAARSLSDRSGLTGTYLEPLGDEIDAMAFGGDTNAITMRNILGTSGYTDADRNKIMRDYYGEKESSSPAHNVVNLGVQNVADQLTMRTDNTRYRQGLAASKVNWTKPEGVAGPHEEQQALQGWINGYGSKGSMDGADGFYGYDASLSGFMVGLDAAIRENWLIGFAGGTGSSDIDKGSSNTDTKSIYGAGYASVGTKDWYADMGFIYGNHDINSKLGDAFNTKSDYTAQTMSFFFGGGKEMVTDYLIYTPQLSFLGNFYGQEGYREESTDAVAREIEKFNTFLLQSSLGGSIGYYSSIGNVTFKPEFRAFWLHEWLGDEEQLNYSLVGGTGGQYNLLLQAPEKDILKLGIGSSAKIGEFLELRADLDTRLGKNYSDYTVLGSLRYQF